MWPPAECISSVLVQTPSLQLGVLQSLRGSFQACLISSSHLVSSYLWWNPERIYNKSVTNHRFFKNPIPPQKLHLLPKPIHSGLPAYPSRLNSIKRMSLSLKRQQLNFPPKRAQSMEERFTLHVDNAAILVAKEEQYGRADAAHMRDG